MCFSDLSQTNKRMTVYDIAVHVISRWHVTFHHACSSATRRSPAQKSWIIQKGVWSASPSPQSHQPPASWYLGNKWSSGNRSIVFSISPLSTASSRPFWGGSQKSFNPLTSSWTILGVKWTVASGQPGIPWSLALAGPYITIHEVTL